MWSIIIRDGLKALIPGSHRLRHWMRKIRPYRSLRQNDDLALRQGLQILNIAHSHGNTDGAVLEVGTGWMPTIPYLFLAAGVSRVILTDIEQLADEQTFAHGRDLAAAKLRDLSDIIRVDEGKLQNNLLRPDCFDYRCPPKLEELASESIDLIYSRTVLEHMDPGTLEALQHEWCRLLRPGGLCIHIIDNSDHFEHRDKRLTRLNFLQLSGWKWKLACLNPQHYQNRLRHSDYVTMFNDGPLALLESEGKPDFKTLEIVDSLHLAPEFQHYQKEDLAILTSLIICQKPAP